MNHSLHQQRQQATEHAMASTHLIHLGRAPHLPLPLPLIFSSRAVCIPTSSSELRHDKRFANSTCLSSIARSRRFSFAALHCIAFFFAARIVYRLLLLNCSSKTTTMTSTVVNFTIVFNFSCLRSVTTVEWR